MADYDELSPHRDPFLKNFLEEEVRRVVGGAEASKDALRFFIEVRESELADDNKLERLFENHLSTLPTAERPQTRPQERRLFNEWEGGLKQELAGWRKELATIESQSIDGQLIFNNARDLLMRLFEAEARESGLLPQKRTQEMPLQARVEESLSPDLSDSEEGLTFVQLATWFQGEKRDCASIKPLRLQDPRGKVTSVKNWSDLLLETAEWLIREGLLAKDTTAFQVGRMSKTFLIHRTINHPTGKQFKYGKRLSNGLYIELSWITRNTVRRCVELIAEFGQDPAQFRVWLRQ